MKLDGMGWDEDIDEQMKQHGVTCNACRHMLVYDFANDTPDNIIDTILILKSR